MITGAEIAQVRKGLNMTQAQLGQLLGVHPLTVSKWERPKTNLKPSPHQAALLQSFEKARQNSPDIGDVVIGLLVGAGVALAIYAILKAAFGEGK